MTIKDIAKEAGYSVGTVSRVLNNHPDVSDKARKKVMAVVKKNHFKLNNNAKHLKQQSNSGIAVIVKGNNNMLFATIVEKLQGLIKERGYVCLIYYIDEDENEVEQALQICRERQPMGILFLGSDLEYYRGRFGDAGIPGLLVTNSAEGMELENLSSVSTDDEGAAQTAIEYLFTLGHREIGVLGGKLENSYAARSRYMGCRKAFELRGRNFDRSRQYEGARFSMEDGYHGMLRILNKMPEVTAVFAMSDVMAIGAIRAIKDRGLRVPEDISVIGFDGIVLSQYMCPRLTTIKQDSEIIARRSLEILLGNIREELPVTYERIPSLFIRGESTCAVLFYAFHRALHGLIIQNLKGMILEREQLPNGNLLHLFPLLLLPGFLGGENVICPFQRHV